jgi:hypothetical protein
MLPFNRILFGTYETIVNRCVEINSDSINLFVPSSNSPSGSFATTQFQIAYKHVKRIEVRSCGYYICIIVIFDSVQMLMYYLYCTYQLLIIVQNEYENVLK